MKKILSIVILAASSLLSASASQTFTVTSASNSQTIYFRISKTSGSVTTPIGRPSPSRQAATPIRR